MVFMNWRRPLASALISALFLAGPAAAAPVPQETQSQTEQDVKQEEESSQGEATFNTVGVSSTQCDGTCTISSATLSGFLYPDRQLWLVGGQDYRPDGHDFDLGAKYLWGRKMRNLLRGTLDVNERDGSVLSAGLDANLHLGEIGGAHVYLLGDVSSVKRGEKRTDFGAGVNLEVSGDHNLFMLYSDRETPEYRIGYLLWNDKIMASVHTDLRRGSKPSVTAAYGADDKRLRIVYDAERGTLFSENILTFGNIPLPGYAARGWHATQKVLTNRSVSDSDRDRFFHSPFFLYFEPEGDFSNVLRALGTYSFDEGRLEGVKVYNAMMFRTRGGQGTVFTQNLDRVPDESGGYDTLYGLGAGYNFGGAYRIAPVFRVQKGNGDTRFSLDVSWFH